MSNKPSATTLKPDGNPAFTPKLRFPEFRDAEGWEQAQISDLAISEASTLALNKLSLVPNGYPVYGADGCVGFINTFAQSEDYIAIIKDGSGVGRLSLREGRSSILGTLAYLKPKTESGAMLSWLFYFLNSLDFKRFIKGSGIPHIYFSDYANQIAGMPSVPEQQKIAECLSSVDELIAAQARKLDALKTNKKGLMQQLFPREGETQPRLRFPQFQDAGEWSNDSLGQIFDTSSGGTPDRSKHEYWNGSIPWITTSLVNFNIITEADEFISDEGLRNSSAKVFPDKTILVAMYGQGKTRGQVAMLGIQAATNQACAAILPRKEVDPRFVFLNLGSRYEEMRRLSNSGGQENLSQGLIQGLQFSYPSDMDEQKAIADCLSSLDEFLVAQTLKVDALKTHKKGLMQQLFPFPEEAL
jgi:type I restriction enzyme S subunit